MAKAVVTVKLMPEGPETDMASIQRAANERIDHFTKEPGEKRFAVKPIAFGLKALEIIFVMDENLGGTEPLEKDLETIPGVGGVEVIDVRRAIG
jgi:elongation factor 1-beta